MNRLIFIFLLFYFPASAETVVSKGSHLFTGDTSNNEACELALNDAKLNALRQVVGQKIKSEELEYCSAVDGKSKCENNQFFLSSLSGDIIEYDIINENIKQDDTVISNEKIYLCSIEIKAKIVKNDVNLDNSIDLVVKLNQISFKDGDELKIDINVNKPLYMTIYQWLPYEEKDYSVYKIFPNNREVNNYIESDSLTLPKKGSKYKIYFPEKSSSKNVDEYLVFIGSNEKINWTDKYVKIEDLKKKLNKEKSLNYVYKIYTVYK